MNGRNHGLTGVAAAVWTWPLAAAATGDAPDPVLWVTGWVAGAQLPDFDTSGSGAARVWGQGTQALAGRVGEWAGGHREATHDVVLAPLAVAAALCGLLWAADAAAGLHWFVSVMVWLALALPVGVGLRMVGTLAGEAATGGARRWARLLRVPAVNLLVSVAFSAWLVASDRAWLFAVAAAGGVVVHVLGDSVTPEGAPVPVVWLWDASARSRQWGARLPGLRVSGAAETALRYPLLLLLVVGVVFVSRQGLVGVPDISGPGVSFPDIGAPISGLGGGEWEGRFARLGEWAVDGLGRAGAAGVEWVARHVT